MIVIDCPGNLGWNLLKKRIIKYINVLKYLWRVLISFIQYMDIKIIYKSTLLILGDQLYNAKHGEALHSQSRQNSKSWQNWQVC